MPTIFLSRFSLWLSSKINSMIKTSYYIYIFFLQYRYSIFKNIFGKKYRES